MELRGGVAQSAWRSNGRAPDTNLVETRFTATIATNHDTAETYQSREKVGPRTELVGGKKQKSKCAATVVQRAAALLGQAIVTECAIW